MNILHLSRHPACHVALLGLPPTVVSNNVIVIIIICWSASRVVTRINKYINVWSGALKAKSFGVLGLFLPVGRQTL